MTNEVKMNTGKIEMGITDVPCSEEDQDMLDMKKYVVGLEKFIKRCPTPMSIAIQGDWGTGKTSIINMLQRKLEGENSIKSIYFNTWQYSQFNMADDLYMSFVNALICKCFSRSEKAKEILGILHKIGTKLLCNTVKNNTGLDVEEVFKQQEERMESIEKLKSKFAEMVADEVGRDEAGRVVVFIDDLDRLNPEVAVELLEVIKLFMDVKNCIFVLAIDYDVVVSGVRNKYGQNVSEEKCRSFFDKIIQLPFRLPVESYRLDNLVRETVMDDMIDDDIEPLSGFVCECLGANPRAYKRLANSFFLIKSVNEALQEDKDRSSEHDQQLDNVLIFGSLCIQMCVSGFYELLAAASNKETLQNICEMTVEAMDAYLENRKIDLEMDEKEKRSICRCLKSFNDFLTDIQTNHKIDKKIFSHLFGIIQMTAITSVTSDNEQRTRAKPIKVDKMWLNGQEQSVNTPTKAFVEAYRGILGDNAELIKAYREEEERILTDTNNRTDSFFRNKRKLCEIDGAPIYIGLSSSTNDKMKYVSKLCRFMKNRGKEVHVIWKYGDTVVFDSDNQ